MKTIASRASRFRVPEDQTRSVRPLLTITKSGLSQGTRPIASYKEALKIVKTGKAHPLHFAGRTHWSLPVTFAKAAGLA